MTPGKSVPLEDVSADWVVSFQVLEHVWDLDWYLGEARRLVKPDGWVLLSTHGTWLYHPHPTDYRRWTRDGLIKELETRGFEIAEIRADVGPLAWTTQFRTLAYHHALSKIPLVGRLLSAVVCSFMYLRMGIEDAATPTSLVETNAAVYTLVARRLPR
jgi:SAM-dependent methyltransferase